MSMIKANWPAPSNISAITSTRKDGFSQPPYDSNNMGFHVGDDKEAVLKNRSALKHHLQLNDEPVWLNQIHSNQCIIAESSLERTADAAITRSVHHPLAVMTADCLPIALCNRQGTEIAMIHAGWKGLVNHIVKNTVDQMQTKSQDLMAWIGPAICQRCFEVGDDVFQAYQSAYPFTSKAFEPHQDKWLANLPLMAEWILNSSGINAVFQSKLCSFELKNDYYSYRRTAQTGRMATLIWFNDTV